MKSDKIDFSDYMSSGDLLPNEENDIGEIFKDSPRKFDFTLLILITITLAISAFSISMFMGNEKVSSEVLGVQNIAVTSGFTPSSKVDSKLVNINSADIEELCTLKGIGEAKATNIVAHRLAHGWFESVEDILEVSGIGQSTFENIKDKICV